MCAWEEFFWRRITISRVTKIQQRVWHFRFRSETCTHRFIQAWTKWLPPSVYKRLLKIVCCSMCRHFFLSIHDRERREGKWSKKVSSVPKIKHLLASLLKASKNEAVDTSVEPGIFVTRDKVTHHTKKVDGRQEREKGNKYLQSLVLAQELKRRLSFKFYQKWAIRRYICR